MVRFFPTFLRHSQGRWAGKPFELLPWQADDLIRPLFGWRRADGTRRFRRAYAEVSKKNGKSTLAAGLALYLLTADGEQGAEIYSAAADRQQAAICFREAALMVGKSPALRDNLQVVPSTKTILFPETSSLFTSFHLSPWRKDPIIPQRGKRSLRT